jgi:Tfp pilus assembly protein PilN
MTLQLTSSKSTPKNASSKLQIGAPPRADLLPPEVAQGVKSKALRRTLVLLILLSVVIAGAGFAGSTLHAVNTTVSLAAANQRTSELLLQQGEYAELREATAMRDKAVLARRVGTSTEINWKSYTAEVQASLPADTVITSFVAEASTPTANYAVSSVPLQGDRIGQISFTATSASLPDVESWLVNLGKVTGFVDASPGAVTLIEDGGYTVGIVMHFNNDVLANRFALVETDTK